MIDHNMTPVEIQTAYRLAVRSCLVAFYQKSVADAKQLTDSWWQRALGSDDISSGMYLHSEAFATATDLAHAKQIPFTDAVREHYFRIIHESTRLALTHRRQPSKSNKRIQVEQMAG